MNSLMDDRGNWVAQVGAPGSKARAACQYPRLIDILNGQYNQGYRIDSAITTIRRAGVNDEKETLRILENTHFINDTLFTLVKRVTK